MSDRDTYLNDMFGTRSGWVAVAYKDQESSWQEKAFRWPQDRAKLTGWARVHDDANVFVCPSLRASEGRRKADMPADGCEWLWADVDWGKITDRHIRAEVASRISKLGTVVIASGSGDNRHVYVKLTRGVDPDEHLRLNTGLRDYLYADHKQADNSLLRLPGSRNWKEGNDGTPVGVVGGHGKRVRPEVLAKVKQFRDVTVKSAAEADDSWERVDTSGVARKLQRLVNMDTDEAEGRFGSRHEAVWAVTGDLIKAGLTPDEIHSLMDAFTPGREKEDEERGYSVHTDVARRIASHDQARGKLERAVERGSDDGSAFEELSDEEIAAYGPTNPLVRRILASREATREADAYEAAARFSAPPDEVSWCVADALTTPRTERPYLIHGLAGAKHNVLVTAEYKTGKTAFMLATVAKALCDAEPFAGDDARVVPAEGRIVGHWNCEVEDAELLDDYVRPMGLNHPERLHVANLRGYSVNVTTPLGKAWAVEWLKLRGVQVWMVDSLARLLQMAGVAEKDNDEVLRVLMAIDQIKMEAGVDVCFVIAHTGRAEMEEGKERARGATVIDDWADARWVMTKDGVGSSALRFLRVDGRGVALDTVSLVYNEDTKGCRLGVESKSEARESRGVQGVLTAVVDHPGINQKALFKVLSERCGAGQRTAREWIDDAVEGGLIAVKRGAGRGSSVTYSPAVKDVGVGGAGKGATPRLVDMRRT